MKKKKIIKYAKQAVLTLFVALLTGALAIHLFDPQFAGYIYKVSAGEARALDGAALYDKYGCQSCHGVNGHFPILPDYPIIAGQNIDYATNQMKHIRDGIRTNGGSSYMKEAMGSPSDRELQAIAAFLHEQ